MSLVPATSEAENNSNVHEKEHEGQQQQQQQQQQPIQSYQETLQGILNFAISQTDGQPPPPEAAKNAEEMDEERKKFLLEYLESLQGKDHMSTVQTALSVVLDPKREEEDRLEHLEVIAEEVEDLNIAEDFITMKGLAPMKVLLGSDNPEFQWRAADVIARLTQNNPKCQSAAANFNLVEAVQPLLHKDKKDIVRVKAIHALSCMMRGSAELLVQILARKETVASIVDCLTEGDPSDRLKVKTMVFLKHLLRESKKRPPSEDVVPPSHLPRNVLVNVSSIHSIVSALSGDTSNHQLWEHGLHLLCALKDENDVVNTMLQADSIPFLEVAASRRDHLQQLPKDDREAHTEELESHQKLFGDK